MLRSIAAAFVLAIFVSSPSALAANAAFQRWLADLWPQAQALGVSRPVFDQATRGLEPDLTLPDLEIPGRAPTPQPEFVSTPADYLAEGSFARLSVQGKKLSAEHQATLAAVERRFGVPAEVILAIWARETNYGAQKLPYNAVRVLATQGYVGRRREPFRQEFLQDVDIKRADMKSSWAGAMGLTQFLPTDFSKYAVDFDGDGRRDIWNSVPDALASTGSQLAGKGWQRGQRWAYEVQAPAGVDCTIGVPEVTKTLAEWRRLGFVPAHGRRLSARELDERAALLLPAGLYGPASLTTKNYYVLKDYNFSDLYVLFVGHLADRIAGEPAFERPWGKVTQMKTAELERMQQILVERGFYGDKIDGKAGMLTRAALGKYQKANGLKVDCWPTAAVLDHMTRAR